MKKKKPPSAGTLEGGQTSVKNGNRLSSGERFGQVDYYDGKGVVLRASGFVKSAGKPPTNVKRGRVGGFSKSARRRMRQWMLTHSAPDGWSVHGATFTIPGPVLPDDLERSIWKWFCREFQRKGWGMVWRLELQRRGARHFHALCILPNDVPSHNVVFLWWDALRSVGAVTYSGECVHRVSSLMAHFGALDYSCRMQSDGGGRGAWMRYLADHASKSKECQEAIGKGRHWGLSVVIVLSRCFLIESNILTNRLITGSFGFTVVCVRQAKGLLCVRAQVGLSSKIRLIWEHGQVFTSGNNFASCRVGNKWG